MAIGLTSFSNSLNELEEFNNGLEVIEDEDEEEPATWVSFNSGCGALLVMSIGAACVASPTKGVTVPLNVWVSLSFSPNALFVELLRSLLIADASAFRSSTGGAAITLRRRLIVVFSCPLGDGTCAAYDIDHKHCKWCDQYRHAATEESQ